jgi:magnesium transporter
VLRVYRLAAHVLTTDAQPESVHPPPKGERTWIEAIGPSVEECSLLVGGLGLHELALEDALLPGHPPKFEVFDDHLFLIAHTPDTDAEEGTRKIALFLAKDWIVTMLREPLERLSSIEARVERDPDRYVQTPAVLAHLILDHMTDGFEQLVDELRAHVEGIEDTCYGRPHAAQMERILAMRQEAHHLARTVRSQRDVCAALFRTIHPSLPKRIQPYLRDIYDHILRVHEMLEGVREGLASARDAYFASVNTRLNEVMRTLTGLTVIMMPLGIITGVWGMNFDVLPGSGSPWGFWLTILGMSGLSFGMFAFFRWRKWL